MKECPECNEITMYLIDESEIAEWYKCLKCGLKIDIEKLVVLNNKCAKQEVIAIIHSLSGEFFIGTNWCRNPQQQCPRGNMPTGEGYALCRTVCQQSNHAEINACNAAGEYKAKGATLYLIGHTYFCEDCLTYMKKFGIKEYYILERKNK